MATIIIEPDVVNYDLVADFTIPASGVYAVVLPWLVRNDVLITIAEIAGGTTGGDIEATTDTLDAVRADTADYLPFDTLAAGSFPSNDNLYTGFRFTVGGGDDPCHVILRLRRTDRIN